MNKLYWIKERNNPQFDKPYYVTCGQMSAKETRKMENPIYGENYMHSYTSKAAYKARIKELEEKGFAVHQLF